ncbi:hypothetical protein Pori4_00095 [Pseudomonas phage vB_PpuM-Pori-4]
MSYIKPREVRPSSAHSLVFPEDASQFVLLDSEPLFTATLSGLLHSYSKMALTRVCRSIRETEVMKAAVSGEVAMLTLIGSSVAMAEAFYRDVVKSKDIPAHIQCLGMDSHPSEIKCNAFGYVVFLPDVGKMEHCFTCCLMSEIVERTLGYSPTGYLVHPSHWVFPDLYTKYALERTWYPRWADRFSTGFNNFNLHIKESEGDSSPDRLTNAWVGDEELKKFLHITPARAIAILEATTKDWVYMSEMNLVITDETARVLDPYTLYRLLDHLNYSGPVDVLPETSNVYAGEYFGKKMFAYARAKNVDIVDDPRMAGKGSACSGGDRQERRYISLADLPIWTMDDSEEVPTSPAEDEDFSKDTTLADTDPDHHPV